MQTLTKQDYGTIRFVIQVISSSYPPKPPATPTCRLRAMGWAIGNSQLFLAGAGSIPIRRWEAGEYFPRVKRLGHRTIGDYTAVSEAHDAVAVVRDVVLVGHEHYGLALAAQILQDRDDLLACACVQVPRRLVGENEGRIIDQSPRNRHSLLFAP